MTKSFWQDRAGNRRITRYRPRSALALARAGAQVLVHYSNGEKEASAVVSEIRGCRRERARKSQRTCALRMD